MWEGRASRGPLSTGHVSPAVPVAGRGIGTWPGHLAPQLCTDTRGGAHPDRSRPWVLCLGACHTRGRAEDPTRGLPGPWDSVSGPGRCSSSGCTDGGRTRGTFQVPWLSSAHPRLPRWRYRDAGLGAGRAPPLFRATTADPACQPQVSCSVATGEASGNHTSPALPVWAPDDTPDGFRAIRRRRRGHQHWGKSFSPLKRFSLAVFLLDYF